MISRHSVSWMVRNETRVQQVRFFPAHSVLSMMTITVVDVKDVCGDKCNVRL
jgi:hypothetical protein